MCVYQTILPRIGTTTQVRTNAHTRTQKKSGKKRPLPPGSPPRGTPAAASVGDGADVRVLERRALATVNPALAAAAVTASAALAALASLAAALSAFAAMWGWCGFLGPNRKCTLHHWRWV